MSTQAWRSNSNSKFTPPESLAARLKIQPPHPRIAPVNVWTRRLGSTREMALIRMAQGAAGSSFE